MATIGFQVHTDKENATPLRPMDKSMNGKSFQHFSKGSNKLTQPTPRKALGSVNSQIPPPPVSHGVKGNGSSFAKNPAESLFKSKKSAMSENLHTGHSMKKTNRSPVVHTGLKKPSANKCASKTRTPKSKQKPTVEPIPVIPDDAEYDSDTIFPHADRLSCYVDKLLTWRPPCLFGTLPDSDSDISDLGDLDQMLDIEPPQVIPFEVDNSDLPEDLSELLVELPSLSPTDGCSETSYSNRSATPDFDQSLDSSLHLGKLQFGTPEPELETLKDGFPDIHNSSSDSYLNFNDNVDF